MKKTVRLLTAVALRNIIVIYTDPPAYIYPGDHMKLKTLYILVLSLILLSFIIVMVSSFSNIAMYTSSDSVGQGLDTYPTVIIDAGHGGEDGGAEVNGVIEKDINLAISRRLADILRLSGCEVIEVRDKDISVYSDGASTLREKKTSDLHNRVELFNSNSNNIVVSIHQNKFDNSKYSGTQIFYSVNDPDSAVLAENIRTAVVMLLQPDNTRELKPAGSDIFILDSVQVPAVIVECGFLSNDNERELLSDPSYQQKMAYAVAMGVLEYNRQQKSLDKGK